MGEISANSCFYFKTISVVSSIHQVVPSHSLRYGTSSLLSSKTSESEFISISRALSSLEPSPSESRCSTVYSASSRAADKKLFLSDGFSLRSFHYFLFS